jgi:hypothetical protein
MMVEKDLGSSRQNWTSIRTLFVEWTPKNFTHWQGLNAVVIIFLSPKKSANHISKNLRKGTRNIIKDWRQKEDTYGGRTYGSLKKNHNSDT